MRYYEILVGGGPSSGWSSLRPDGSNNPNALRVEMSIEKGAAATSGTGNNSFIRIYGVPLEVLKQSANFNFAKITVKGGFHAPSLPLANLQAAHSGLLIQSVVIAGFGNWRGADITLDLVLRPDSVTTQSGVAPLPPARSDPRNEGAQSPGATPSSRLARRSLPRAFAPRPLPLDMGDLGGSLGSVLEGGFQAALSALTSAIGGGGFLQGAANLVHNLMPGMPLSAAIMQTLTTAYPNFNIKMMISPLLMLAYQDSSLHQNMQQYAAYIKQLSAALAGGGGVGAAVGDIAASLGAPSAISSAIGAVAGAATGGGGGAGSQGIDMFVHGNELLVTDWTQPAANHQLAYTDLIGQPTWINLNQIQFQTVMRADLKPGDSVSMPRVPFFIDRTNVSNAMHGTSDVLPYKSLDTTFSGTFNLESVRHVGDSRSPDGANWRTDCLANLNENSLMPPSPLPPAVGNIAGTIINDAFGGGLSSIPSQARFQARRQRFYGARA